MVASQIRLIGGGSAPRWLLLAGWLVGVAALAESPLLAAEPTAAADAPAAVDTPDHPAEAPAADDAVSNQPQYAQMSFDEEYKKRFPSQLRSPALSILQKRPTKFASDADKKAIDDYYQTFALPRWSQIEYASSQFARPESMSLLGFRKDLRRDLSLAKGDARGYLNAMVLDFMTKLVSGNYHPFAQVNAALMIGELDDEASGNEVKPYAKALPVLIRIVEDGKQRDAVRAAAMVGILRHARAGVDDAATRNALTAAMLKELSSKIASPVTAEGQVWIRGQAIEALGCLGSAGENGEVFKAILNSLGDASVSDLVRSELSYTTRCIAAKNLGRLNYTGVKGDDTAEAGTVLGQLCVQVCKDGLRVARTASDPTLARRVLTVRLNAILAALKGVDGAHKGILSVADDQQKTSLAELQTSLEVTMEALNSKESQAADVEAAAAKLRDDVSDWLQKQSA